MDDEVTAIAASTGPMRPVVASRSAVYVAPAVLATNAIGMRNAAIVTERATVASGASNPPAKRSAPIADATTAADATTTPHAHHRSAARIEKATIAPRPNMAREGAARSPRVGAARSHGADAVATA